MVVDFGKMALGTRKVLCRAFHDAQFNPGDILEDLQTKLHDLSWAVWEPNRILRSMTWVCAGSGSVCLQREDIRN